MTNHLNEIIGILIVLFIFFFPFLQRLFLKRHMKQEEERSSIKPPPLPKRSTPQTPPVVTERLFKEGEYEFHSELEEYKKKTAIEGRHLGTRVNPHFDEEVTSSAFSAPLKTKKRILKKLSQNQEMIIEYEILSKPLSLRDYER